MAEGIPHQLHWRRAKRSNRQAANCRYTSGALPIASTLQLAKAAAVPAAMATGAGLLGRALKGKKYAPASTEDMASVLLTPALQRQGLLDEAMVGGVEGAANLAKAGNNRPALAIELAKRLENEGVSRDEIWTRTSQSYGYGVYRGKDGKLRFEIDDSAMAWDDDQYKRFRRMREGSEMPLEGAVTHPELYDAYPEMLDTTLFRGKSGEGGGSAAPYGYEYIRASTGYGGPQADRADMLSTMGHEAQHLIQGGEGFAKGGDISSFDDITPIDVLARAKELESRVWELPGGSPERIKLARELSNLTTPYTPYGQYRALAGEAEARAVQTRMDMTPAERAANPFYADFDVPEADQIVRYGDSPSAMVAYHGSPHEFDVLDPTKIGTGEGAQAYGYGAYVAESKGVAQTYQPRDFDAEEIMMARYKEAESAGDYNRMEQWENAMLHDTPDDLRKRSLDMDYDEDYRQAAAEVAEELAAIPSTSHLYEIDVPDEDIAKMLDWDAPFNKQPEALKKYIRNLDEDYLEYLFDERWGMNYFPEDMTGGELHRVLEIAYEEDMVLPSSQLDKINLTRDPGGKEAASIVLGEAGIPGIKYYDQGSRGKQKQIKLFNKGKPYETEPIYVNTKQEIDEMTKYYQDKGYEVRVEDSGTRNMVLFDDLARRAKVLKRNDETIAQPSVDEFIGKLLED